MGVGLGRCGVVRAVHACVRTLTVGDIVFGMPRFPALTAWGHRHRRGRRLLLPLLAAKEAFEFGGELVT